MNKSVITDEAKRLRIFIELLNIPKMQFAQEMEITPPMVTKYLDGTVKISVDLVKKMNTTYNLSFTWFFTGKGSKKAGVQEKKLIHDFGFLLQSISSMEAQIEAQNRKIDKLTRDLYNRTK
ncbi:helix-turn-helix transcriptional regulator [Pedobacter sp. Hv1]|uniref:helix-turn-helix domain-containing protein n=1 Tax=Pedobacter sp. Hv1 TaxID=1740090 RepID=UPI0006D898A8|nr:helix-turn-helix transcriptional regulator [Pedobacter sp. Hv1]KQC02056.1 hypothetical protein AQF98_00340 [Pedobacter sp. Hv1]